MTKKKINVDIAILGAGIAGLAASLRSKELNYSSILFEKEKTPGGLLDNFTINGFRFDKAVHLSFANEDKVRSIFDQTPYYTHPSDSYCYEDGLKFKHPIQNNLFPLSASEKAMLIESFIQRPNFIDNGDYESWLFSQYGEKLANRYPIKYTYKYWKTAPNLLSTSWIGNRMRQADLSEILQGSFSSETPNHYYTKEMRYPKKGGYKSFIEPLIKISDIRCNHKLVGLNFDTKILTFENGIEVKYNKLINTLPLPLLIKLVDNVPKEVLEHSKQLKATSIDLISVGFNKIVTKDLWFYIYDEDILASRAYSPSIKSPDNAPTGCSSLQFEIYSNNNQNSQYNENELMENTKYAIKKLNIANDDQILFMNRKFVKYGNVIFFKEMEKHREVVRNFLELNDVISCGRFGEWDYLWSNQSFMSGYNSL